MSNQSSSSVNSSNLRSSQHSTGNSQQQPTPILYDLLITPMQTVSGAEGSLPKTITLVRPDPTDLSKDLLYLDQIPMPRDSWTLQPEDHILHWKGAYGGGQLHLSKQGHGGLGVIGDALQGISVTAAARARFLCSVAENVGASYVSDGKVISGLLWDPHSIAWQSANWQQGNNRLLLSYTVTPGGPLQPPMLTFEFADQQTEALPWDPMLGAFAATLALGSQKGAMVWDLGFRSNVAPDNDNGTTPPNGPDTVYPYWLQAVEDAAASSINGVLVIDDTAPKGKLIGLQGVRVNNMVAGYYQSSAGKATFAIFNGKLHIDGQSVASSKLVADTLSWTGLTTEQQQQLGLPAAGQLIFSATGCNAKGSTNGLLVCRLTNSAAITTITAQQNLHPQLHAVLQSQQQALSNNSLDIYGLLAMTPFVQNSKGAWNDIVQETVRGDLATIMNSFVPSKIWSLLFADVSQPELSGELAIVAASPVKGSADPSAWYQSLATAVLTQGMSGGSDPNCKNMNGPRAAAWLKQQVSNSAVYQYHSQLLFQYQWRQRFPLFHSYIEDQNNNAASYEAVIKQQIASAIQDINTNVASNDASPKDMKQQLIDEVNESGQYALNNRLYWAFAYYVYNTAPAVLANIAYQISMDSGSTDGTALTRLFQQNITVLTALDPSNYFAKQYNQTINIFMATNILPSMYGFTGDADDFSLVKEYLQTFVSQNINNEDAEIAKVAEELKSLLAEQNLDKILEDSIERLRKLSDAIYNTLALPYIAARFVAWFQESYPKLANVATVFGTLLIGGLSTMAIFNLISQYKGWRKLTPAQRAEVVLNSCQVGLQIISAMVKRGVRIYMMFSVETLTTAQRKAAIAKILFDLDSDDVDQGLFNVAEGFSAWLGDTAGSTAGRVLLAAIANGGNADLPWTAVVFGRNLDEFITTRLGPLLILAGIGLSIYFISTGEKGAALGSDIVNIISGSLTLFAMVGGWAVEAGYAAAEGALATMISIAGPLAIVGALVGVGLLIYEMLQTPPDPVQEFVNDYVKAAGFYVTAACSAIDYAIPYADSAQHELMMMGFTLGAVGKSLSCGQGGGISLLSSATSLPDCVWQVSTDGLGMSQIATVALPINGTAPVPLLLSLMSDRSVSFQPRLSSGSQSSGSAPTVVSQTWLSQPKSNATTVNKGEQLKSITLTFQPVIPDSKGHYDPSQASGWLVQTESGLAIATDNGSVLTLVMAGMAPNYVTMQDLSFLLNTTPSTSMTFGASYGTPPSLPLTFSVTPALPGFLTLNTATGTISPNGGTANTALQQSEVLTVANSLATQNVTFTITVSQNG